MSRLHSVQWLVAPVIAILVVTTTPPAEAAIRCDGPYQIVQGQPISTPYCQDSYLAVVAREYGLRVSASAIRQSPSTKAQVCRVVGRDNRAQSACASVREPGPRRAF